jgi:hypothetical protein
LLISGRDGSVLSRFTSEILGDYFGESLVSIGDLNGDGIDEVAVGAPGGNSMPSPPISQYPGRVYVISFRVVSPPSANALANLQIGKQGSQHVLTWNTGLINPILERTVNFSEWEVVDDVAFDGIHILPADAQTRSYYRLRFQREE